LTVDQWDANPWLLNTEGAVIDLRTGEQRRHSPYDYMTKITTVARGGECPIWQRFLDRITDHNVDLAEFLQRIAGYSLTGCTSEHALFFCYGTGANGKSVFINTLAEIMGAYHRAAPIETFAATANERHPTELAGLCGARLVTCTETEDRQRWAEAKIKALTGGDTISARYMRQDFFEFKPQFKLLIAGNHKPGLSSVDEAMRRRLHLIPFAVTIPPHERDPELGGKLKAEYGGILAWMVDGCLEWQEHGLRPPPVVTEATAAYLESEDAVANWLSDRCVRDAQSFTLCSELYSSWSRYAEQSGEYTGSSKRFSESLEAKGFVRGRRNFGRGFIGIRLIGEVIP
jgi:putative DNA primase/helicase